MNCDVDMTFFPGLVLRGGGGGVGGLGGGGTSVILGYTCAKK